MFVKSETIISNRALFSSVRTGVLNFFPMDLNLAFEFLDHSDAIAVLFSKWLCILHKAVAPSTDVSGSFAALTKTQAAESAESADPVALRSTYPPVSLRCPSPTAALCPATPGLTVLRSPALWSRCAPLLQSAGSLRRVNFVRRPVSAPWLEAV
ncbi:hypothetical protein GN244_ATG16619 [Phytophthora infestans]|uniref:Uncharacterized protein n=1 Tax=Phytophthora infestans TaxID=4787 RepID=A0A833SC09_PHYIN|nr:hypothetical protein GN244_ATG16619 [Phytophthora infestans]KAF4139710.1 hypothetical protein GN958_ATG11195 [Phytophthora infestans]